MKVKQSKYSLKDLFPNLAPYLKTSSPFLAEDNGPDWYETVMEYLQ